ncbi:hypothetical protein D9757_000248 [Collybiopsis confluens]|uniref:Riboflavin kinase n=1 Tax=Collybiopsis confluens TaxID=2823264 RepID=A0A8H5MHN0_9AGAR|nr:hypothetical protein D9757_000248 [Collybiopsis confluens]
MAETVRPAAPIQTSSSRAQRPLLVGPSSVTSPYPIALSGRVCKGFGRGGKDLGCPTANFPEDNSDVEKMVGKVETGVYYGWARVIPTSDQVENGDAAHSPQNRLSEFDTRVHPMVMSLGWNPFYKNEKLTAEIHVMHEFGGDFYEYELRAMVLGYIRPELDYINQEALIEDIDTDKLVAQNCLAREAYRNFSEDKFFFEPSLSGSTKHTQTNGHGEMQEHKL